MTAAAFYYFRPKDMKGLPEFARELPDGSIDWWPSRKSASHRDGAARFKEFVAWMQGNGTTEEQTDALEAILRDQFGKVGPMEEGFIAAMSEAAIEGYKKPGAREKLVPFIKEPARSGYWMPTENHLDCAAAILGVQRGR
jgi:hypothetical protein